MTTMTSLFVTSLTPSLPHGVYAVSQPPPAVITPTGTSNSVIIGQFPWGPPEALTYPDDMGAFGQTYAPMGMDRTNSAWLSVIRKGWPRLGAVRAAASPVQATAVIEQSSTTILNVTAKYGGAAGLGIICTISAPDDGVASHWNFSALVSSASGTTQELWVNNNVSGTGSDVLPDLTNSVLLASVTKAAAGTPDTGSTTMTGGTSPAVESTAYVGTPGMDNKGLALLESDDTIDGVFCDDPGSSLQSAVNAGLYAHAALTTDRICYISGIAGQSASAAQADVANYRNINCVYVDPWAYVRDDTDGTMRNCPASCWAASVAAQIPPSLSIAWRSLSGLLAGIAKLEANRGAVRAQNTASGIATLISGKNGGYTFEAGVNTSGIAGQTDLMRTRMGIFIARSAIDAWYPYVDAPNIPYFQQDLINSAEAFLATLKKNATVNPAVLPFIVDYALLPSSSQNTQQSIAAGQYTVAAQVQTGSAMSVIGLSMQYGASVSVSTT